MSYRTHKLRRALVLQAQQPRPICEIVFSPSLGVLMARPPAALLPPVIRFDPWRDFTESLYPLRFLIGRQLSEVYT
ncbi:hypothetical protein GCM10022631_04680 [Deinococcus rubellus]|uniref:Uncharacterized protein n=1 Tax=Deinococcus rubellus TaxID=1889240 RepID=A0ABY5YIV0_9DEIO|nr:hypothetical protein [Deinococcus rubellus]UWX64179.1 hypothetical protein N0D28_00410 [Deinococcus rubellus]